MAEKRKRVPSTDDLLDVARIAQNEASTDRDEVAVIGGLAMQLYGSRRLTDDVDVVALKPISFPITLKKVAPLSFGGFRYKTLEGIDVDWVVRKDEYEALYEDTFAHRKPYLDIQISDLEHLAAMKFAAQRPNDYEDLMYLLVHPDLDYEKARDLVYRFVGGRFATDQFDAAREEARWRASKG